MYEVCKHRFPALEFRSRWLYLESSVRQVIKASRVSSTLLVISQILSQFTTLREAFPYPGAPGEEVTCIPDLQSQADNSIQARQRGPPHYQQGDSGDPGNEKSLKKTKNIAKVQIWNLLLTVQQRKKYQHKCPEMLDCESLRCAGIPW